MRKKLSAKPIDSSTPPAGFRWGRDIRCEEMQFETIAVTPEGRPTVFLGYMDKDIHDQSFKYSVCVADRGERREKYSFVELRYGNLRKSGFLSDRTPYRLLADRFVRLPAGAYCDYGVYQRETFELDVDLTRELFGVTFEELEKFINIFQTVTDMPIDPIWKHSRITFSKSRENDCDLSKAWIPSAFPFIAFGDTNYLGGHVSLHGFYQLIAFLCRSPYAEVSGRAPKGFTKHLIDAGAELQTIQMIKKAYFDGQGGTIIDRAW